MSIGDPFPFLAGFAKSINPAYLNNEVARPRFIRGARSAAKLRHRSVASVFRLGTEGDMWFYMMEFIEGESLKDVIQHQAPLPVPRSSRSVSLTGSIYGRRDPINGAVWRMSQKC